MANKRKFRKEHYEGKSLGEILPKANSAAEKIIIENNLETKETDMVLFDRKSRIVLGVLLLGYLFFSFLKIHTSNIAYWDIYFGAEASSSVIAGTPKNIRMDEWMVSTPALLGQVEMGMPIKNFSNGDGNSPLIWGFPVKDIGTILKPNHWPYFLLDIEHAFAFSWNFPLFGFLMSAFLLFKILTRDNFWLSLFATLFIFLGSAVQWWSYIIINYMMYLNIAMLSVLVILYGKKRIPVAISYVLLIFSIYGFISNLYPPFQIPLVYLYLFVFAGVLIRRRAIPIFQVNKLFLVVSTILFLLILSFFAWHYYSLVDDTYRLILNTVYPGKRISTGGDLISGKFFSEYFMMYMSENNLPSVYLNICEASGFLVFFPIIFYAIAYEYVTTKKFDTLSLLLSVFIVFFTYYVVIGFPDWLAKASLISMSPSYRALPILQLGNIFLLISFLGRKHEKIIFNWIEFIIVAVCTLLFFIVVTASVNDAAGKFFNSSQVTIIIIIFSLVYLLIRYNNVKYAVPVLLLILTGISIKNFSVNPVTHGLASVLEHPLVMNSKSTNMSEGSAGWAVFSDQAMASSNMANLLKAGGLSVFNGVKLVPLLRANKFLNPLANDSSYNRYAHIDMVMYIDYRDTVIFDQRYNDGYMIRMDPCSPRLKKLGIRYIVFTYKPQDVEVRCMKRIDSPGYYIYKLNN